MPGTTRNIDQLRAAHAWKAVEAAASLRDTKDYAREAKRLPVRIKVSGLGSSIAFVNAKSGDGKAGGALLKDLCDWLVNERRMSGATTDKPSGSALIVAIVNGDARLLRRMTEEALSYLQWLTRFAEAEIGVDEDAA